MKKATKRNQGIGYYFFNLIFNVIEAVLIGAGLMAIVYCLTRLDVIDYTITSSPVELFICLIAGALILGGINFKMQLNLLKSFKNQMHKSYLSGKEKGHAEGFKEGYRQGCKESTDSLLKKSPKYFNIERVK